MFPLHRVAAVLLLAIPLLAAQKPAASKNAADALPNAQPDPAIAKLLQQVSAQRIQATIEKLVSFGNRSTLSSNAPGADASDKGIVAARKWIFSEFERYSKDCGGCLEVKYDEFTEQPTERIAQPTDIANVFAVMKGTNPEAAKRIYLVTGHYDSRNSTNENVTDAAPGANDDGSGTAVSLECARVLSRHRFPATIIFLTVAGEEQGLNGSKHFAKWLKDNNWQLEAALNNDIVGGDKSPGQDATRVRVFSEGLPAAADEKQLRMIRATGMESDSASRELARYIAETGRSYLPAAFQPELEFRRDRYLRGGDHSSFNDQGFAAVRLTEYRENFTRQHQNLRTENGIEYGDLPKWVDFGYTANVARLNAAALAELASGPASPANVRLLTKQLENDTSLAWDAAAASADSGAVTYEVLWRATTAPEWEHARNVGSALTATLPVSKDNVIFAVRAVDAAGHRSLPVVPQPQR